MKITDIHKKLLREIRKNPNGSLREYGAAIDINSTSTVDYYIKNLMLAGLLRKGNKWEVIDSNQTRT